MSFCRNCGSKLIDGHQFCAECGEPIKKDSNQMNPSTEKKQPNQRASVHIPNTAPKQPLFKSKKSKIVTIISAVVVALLAGGYYLVKDMTSPTAVAEQFIDAINKKDAGTVKSYINVGQYEIKVNDQEAKTFITYLHNHPRMITSIAEGLLHDASTLEGKSPSTTGETSPYATIQHKGKKWGLFENYTIQIQTFYTDVSSDAEKTDIFLNGTKEITMNEDDKTLGPFLPGEYKIKAVVNGEYGKVEDEKVIDTSEMGEQTATVHFDWEDYYVNLYSNYEDAIVYVNDKNTKKEISDLSEFGPVPLDGSIKVYAQKEFNGGEKKSKVETLKNNTTDVDLTIDYYENDVFFEEDYEVDVADDTEAIQQVIVEHYNLISNDEFSNAYNLFSSARKSKVTLDGWSKGLTQNISDSVTELEVISIDGNTAKAYVEMTSYDQQDNGTLVQEWGGNWNLVKESDGWRLDKAELEKLASRTE